MKCLVLTRRKMLTICACFVVCGLAVVFSVKGIQAVQTAYVQKVPIYSVPTPDKQVALTFDCAWDIDHTAEYIEILQKYQVEATFFVTGVWAEKYTNAVKQISEAGYEIGNLGNTYERIPQLSQADMMSNLMQCNETLKKITGKHRYYSVRPMAIITLCYWILQTHWKCRQCNGILTVLTSTIQQYRGLLIRLWKKQKAVPLFFCIIVQI